MLNTKISYYRKKNMLTQEQLAEKLNVSRQTITKWENGSLYPSIDTLINLSNIFNVTIDTLVKNDDCITDNCISINNDELINFIIEAKTNTYAAKQNKVSTDLVGAHKYAYEKGNYKYYDTFYGSSSFSGQEIVYQDDQACWSLNYFGKVTGDNFNGDFLKDALMQVSPTNPYRGPTYYQKGNYTYIANIQGDFNHFNGQETIYYMDQAIYECIFHGGKLY